MDFFSERNEENQALVPYLNAFGLCSEHFISPNLKRFIEVSSTFNAHYLVLEEGGEAG